MSWRKLILLLAAVLTPAAFSQPHTGIFQPEKTCSLTSLQVCALHVVADEGWIVSSPLRATTNDLLIVAPLLAATGIAVDKDVSITNRLGHDPAREKQFRRVSDYGGIYGPVAAAGIGYFAGSLTHNDHLRETATLAGEAMVDATILDQGLKYAINRESPQQGNGNGDFWPHGTKTWPDGQSMPSEHAINAWAFAHAVAAEYSGWRTKLIVYSLAGTVSASRVVAREHFTSDVIVGSTFGYLIGGMVVNHRSAEHGKGSLSFAPVRTPNGTGFQVAWNFGN